MDHTQMIFGCVCGPSAQWMALASYAGLFVSTLFAAYHGASCLRSSNCSCANDFCHFFMYLGMAYMFIPDMSWHVIPGSLWALGFALMSLYLAVKLALSPDLSNLSGRMLHILMNLAMVYMFMSELSTPWLDNLALAFYGLYAGFYAGLLFRDGMLVSDNGQLALSSKFVGNSSNIVMAAAMAAMSALPVCMHMH